jgi:hypothetical protein
MPEMPPLIVLPIGASPLMLVQHLQKHPEHLAPVKPFLLPLLQTLKKRLQRLINQALKIPIVA